MKTVLLGILPEKYQEPFGVPACPLGCAHLLWDGTKTPARLQTEISNHWAVDTCYGDLGFPSLSFPICKMSPGHLTKQTANLPPTWRANLQVNDWPNDLILWSVVLWLASFHAASLGIGMFQPVSALDSCWKTGRGWSWKERQDREVIADYTER